MRLVCHPVINNVAWRWLPCCPHALLGLLAYSYGSGCSWDWRRNQKQCIIITFCDDLCQNNFIAITLIFSQVLDHIFIKQRQISSSGAGKKKNSLENQNGFLVKMHLPKCLQSSQKDHPVRKHASSGASSQTWAFKVCPQCSLSIQWLQVSGVGKKPN